ncbi:MAG TPA: alpha/beta hydrolase, partial [Terriglobales bacterium]|nr:alpha/beta hydrolase [Terriglobales bacterium]
VVPSLPGFPGAAAGHLDLDDTVDWIVATLDLLEASDLEGADLIGESVAGMLAAEVAALVRPAVRRLILIGSFGLYDPEDPVRNPFHCAASETPALLCASSARYSAALGCHCHDPAELADWEVRQYRAHEAAARLMWPFGDRGLAKRLRRIECPTLLLWGERDALVPVSYARRFAAGITRSRVAILPAAGHLASVDAPEEAAAAIADFLA